MNIKSIGFFPSEIYSQHLSIINGIKFTPREIDVIACVLHGKNDKAIAQLLTTPGKPHLSFKTIRAHLDNITRKIESGMRQNLIKFIEESGKFQIMHEYYSSLLLSLEFKKILYNFSSLIHKERFSFLIIASTINEGHIFAKNLLTHLNLVGAKATLEIQEGFINTIKVLQSISSIKHVIFILPSDIKEEEHYLVNIEKLSNDKDINFQFKDIIFLGSSRREHYISNKKNLRYINIEYEKSYYLLFLNILQKLLPQNDLLPDAILKFRNKLNNVQKIDNIQLYNEDAAPQNRESNFFVRYLKIIYISIFIILSFFVCYSFVPQSNILSNIATKSDLVLPSDSLLLKRSSVLKEIKESIEGKQAVQTVALVGVEGSGKTTIARLYGDQAKADIIWEFNAETQESFKNSFENLATNLVLDEKDKKTLNEIQEISDSADREDKIIDFVKKRLKLANKWFFIYDNVEDLSSIEKYFPQDANTWGKGKIIITTRNSNTKDNNYVSHNIYLGKLNDKEKYELFTKILSSKEANILQSNSEQGIQRFLELIPPFPLDISLVANYIKATKLPLNLYQEKLTQDTRKFDLMQDYLLKDLKEEGDYLKTRYNIITISLYDIIKTHPDFESLLLLITMLDSKDIPRDILDKYKNSALVDSFIHYLKKYFLIASETRSTLGPGIAIHKTIQNISLSYLIESSTVPISEMLQSIAYSFDNYIDKSLEKDPATLKLLLSNSIVFLNHSNLFKAPTNALLHGTIGKLYFALGEVNSTKIQE